MLNASAPPRLSTGVKHMRPRLNILLLVVGIPQVLLGAALASATPSVVTNFTAGVVLTTAELENVVQLANLCGMTEVVEVRTFRFRPSGTPGIKVKSSEKMAGRMVSFETLLVERDGWAHDKPGQRAKVIGSFWSGGDLVKHELTVFKVDKQTIRVSVAKKVDQVSADRIISAFLDGKVRHTPGETSPPVSNEDFSDPVSLYVAPTRGLYGIYFPSRLMHVTFRADGDEMVVEDVRHIYY